MTNAFKILSRIAAAATGVVMLSGCAQINGLLHRGGDAAAEATPSPTPYYTVAQGVVLPPPDTDSKGRKKVTFLIGSDETNALTEAVDDYNTASADYFVEIKQVPGSEAVSYSQLTNSFLGGASDFDVADIDAGWTAEFASKGYIVPLDDYASAAGIDFGAFLPNALVPCLYNRELFSMPRTVSLSMMFFRNDIIGSVPTSWSEALETAVSRQGTAGTAEGLIFGTNDAYDVARMIQEMVSGFGGSIFDSNGEVRASGDGIFNALAQLSDIFTSDGVPNNLNYSDAYDAGTRFFSGESVMMLNAAQQWARGKLSAQSGNYAMGPVPRGGIGNPDILWCSSLAINANSNNKDGAWDFINFMVSSVNQQNLAQYGGFLSVLKDTLDKIVAVGNNAYFTSVSFRQAINAANAMPVSVHYNDVARSLEQRLYQFISGQLGINETIAGIQTDAREIYATPAPSPSASPGA